VLKKFIENEEPMVKQDLTTGMVSLSYIIIVFVWCVYTLQKNREKLEKEEVKDRIGKMYMDIPERKHTSMGLFYFPYMLLRMFLFIMIGTVFLHYDVFAVQSLMLFNTFCYIWYFQCEPHSNQVRRIREGVNEIFTMIGAYHLMLFTNAYLAI